MTETFAVVLVGTDWKLKQVVADVSLAADREPGVPMKINGATVKSDTVSLFPGTYEVTSGLKTLSYGRAQHPGGHTPDRPARPAGSS